MSDDVFVKIDDGFPVLGEIDIVWPQSGIYGTWSIEVEYHPETYLNRRPVQVRIMWPGSWTQAGRIAVGKAIPTKLVQPADKNRLPTITLQGDGPLEFEPEP